MKTYPCLASCVSWFLLATLWSAVPVCGSTVLGFQKSGNVGYELVGFGQPSTNSAFSGNVFLGTMPPGATIEYAAVYTNDFRGPTSG
ncbi:MAG: hypothetical protein HKO57_12340, partial [Akkermansiaceae bacterium]|nr:hypothetical protein [Akkermansiaceae bacterium]